MALKVSKLLTYFGKHYPYSLAESWDNVGLILGNPRHEVDKVLLALDLSYAVFEEAIKLGAGLVVTHHPPIFRAIKSIDTSTIQGEIIGGCLKHEIACIALHTNLDSAVGGLNDTLCDLLGLQNTKPLSSSGTKSFFKLVVFVPVEAADKVRQALFDAGAGELGAYDQCSFNTQGLGTFRGLEGSNPTLGEVGKLEEVQEVKLEVLLPRHSFGTVYSALLRAHPYEEVAYDLIPLANRDRSTGLGRIGKLEAPITLQAFCNKLHQELGMMVLRLIGNPEQKVQKIALCTGAGSDFMSKAASLGADLYLSAEMKHHHALEAMRRGLCVVETDHLTLEQIIWPRIKEQLNQDFGEELEVFVSQEERNPWKSYSEK